MWYDVVRDVRVVLTESQARHQIVIVVLCFTAALKTSLFLLRIGDSLGVELSCGEHLRCRRLLLPRGAARVERILKLLGEGATVFTRATGKEMLLLVEFGGRGGPTGLVQVTVHDGCARRFAPAAIVGLL